MRHERCGPTRRLVGDSLAALSLQPSHHPQSCTRRARACSGFYSRQARREPALANTAHTRVPSFCPKSSKSFIDFTLRSSFFVYHLFINTPERPPATPELDDERDPLARLREQSKLFFGNKNRLEVAAAIAESKDGLVNATDLQWALRLSHSRVRSQLVAMAEFGLLAEVSIGDQKRWYLRQESPFWNLCIDWVERWTE